MGAFSDIETKELIRLHQTYPHLSADILNNPFDLDHPYNRVLECPACGQHRDWQLGYAMYWEKMPGYLGPYALCNVCQMPFLPVDVRKPYMEQMLLFEDR